MQQYRTYIDAEKALVERIIYTPHWKTKAMHERIGDGFMLIHPEQNFNERSNYTYAEAFFKWMMTGEKALSQELIDINPWVGRFVSEDGLPNNFSASYGWKIKKDLADVMHELKTHEESRRAYLPILYPDDKLIRTVKTTHEYPCTIGMHFFIRSGMLHLMANMRSNNCVRVMPYDVYNFTRLQQHVATELNVPLGFYYHQINSAHVYNGDVKRWLDM